MSSDELIKLLKANGWVLVSSKGDHFTFKHPNYAKIITITHPRKDMKKGLLHSILKTAKLK